MTNQINDLKFDTPFIPKPDTEYNQQARKFLANTQTKFKAELIGYEPYFDDDKDSRDVYRITLKRNGKSFTLRFGQSLAETGKYKPEEYDVLACLTKEDPGTFEDFCGKFGFDTDSIKAHKTYKAVCKEWLGVKKLFGDVLEALRDIN